MFEVQKIETNYISKDELLEIAAYAENYSNHPIAKSIKNAYKKEIDTNRIKNIKEISGHGISVIVDDKNVLIGNEKLMEENKIQYTKSEDIGTILYIEIKEDSKGLAKNLKNLGVKKTVMLTGDKKTVGEDVGEKLGLDEVYTELLPDGKVEKVEKLMQEKTEKGKLVFVGDGINDSPVLAMSDIGIAMGALGSDAAIEAADVVIMTDEPSKIADAIGLSRKTMKIVKENIVFAIFVKVLVLVLTAIGLSTMWEAVFADVGVSIIAIINALRMLKVKK